MYVQGRVNVSLNMISPIGIKGTGAPQFQMRTLSECALQDTFPGKVPQGAIKKYAKNHCTATQPFILSSRYRFKELKDQLVNRLSMLCGPAYVTQDLGVQIQTQEYIAVLTVRLPNSCCRLTAATNLFLIWCRGLHGEPVCSTRRRRATHLLSRANIASC